jgi:hypothetical protein
MFHFLAGLLVVGIIIAMMFASPGFRNFVFVAIFLIGGGIWWLVENANRNSEQRKKVQQVEEYRAATAIKVTDLTLNDMKLAPSYGLSDFILSGTVANDANSSLVAIFFQVTMTDCVETNCRIVGQKDTSAAVSVPSKQLRSFSSYAIRFDNLPATGAAKRSWSYRITGLRAG